MGKQRAVLGALTCVLGACGPVAKNAGEPAGPKALCVDPAAPGGSVIALDYDEPPGLIDPDSEARIQPALEQGWVPMGMAAEGEATYVLVIADGCGGGGCNPDPHVVRVVGGAITHRVSVPGAETIPQSGDYPFMINWMMVSGGAVWLAYNIVGEPEPGVGSTTRNHVAVFGPEDLSVRFTTTTSQFPEASVLETCTSELAAVDADCDGDMDLVQAETCAMGEEAPSTSHYVFEQNADQVFVQRKGP